MRKSARRMLAQLQKRLWKICWNIWEHRNSFVHNRNQNLNNKTILDINQEIHNEYTLHLDMLPQRLAPLFSLDVLTLIAKPQNDKMKWLFTVWSSRDVHYGPHRNRTGVYDLYKK